ncbi:2,3,4,5-tetrahydropyridine-2,6-dicarboxylate N-succinyltransferase [Candidatus Cytomitobacter primus]|uniref:2,3,4,5-tetrahydropyridine-2,6-dicarboxylate N-succinyltransferase n=1 Tax=Candidatus Cytomitobacter primus TaxID=2066024 RepID=A0A5C0UFT3_9PROT|nr:2,3,4,5-tetrahydropyridine-2,6-dicarboxylate N-succinyltransferase [Candidatus Cytomitobacter primus]QEK38659.1 2,3,4,5-tetrahydropyridine-2,6-dicarboxylate N-succinyltransferase [Candidatus Cytomitobacter primus]
MSIDTFLSELESGNTRIVRKNQGKWELNQPAFSKINEIFKSDKKISKIDGLVKWADKIDMQSNLLHDQDLLNKDFRLVPGSWVRRGAYIGPKSVIMTNSFVNIGAHIGDETMVDSGVTIGSCAYIGAQCHISSNVIIAGVLEPSQHMPVIIEDNVFIGAQSLIAEGVVVPEGCVIGAGTKLTSSTKIFDVDGDEINEIEPYSVIIPGTYSKTSKISFSCAVVIKKVDKNTKSKTNINELLRD